MSQDQEPTTSTEIVAAGQGPPLAALLPPDAESLVRAFLDGRNASTLDAYARDLADFAAFLRVETAHRAMGLFIAGGNGLANRIALEYRAALTDRGLAPSTIKRRLSALRSAVKVARTIGLINWALDVESPKAESYRDTRGPGLDGWLEIERTARARASLGDPRAVRDLAILHLAWTLGLRRGEIISLDLAHVELDVEPPGVQIRGKGRAQRERRTLPAAAVASLRAWIGLRGDWEGPLFVPLDRNAVNRGVSRLTGRSIGNLVPAAGHRAGLRAHINPHKIRHASITTVLDLTNGDVRRAAQFSRHKDVRTLMIYDDRRKDDAGELAGLLAKVGISEGAGPD